MGAARKVEAGLPESEGPGATPMLRQYWEAKSRHPDAVLFFRLGDFYEMFFEDAVKASELLGITLTARAKGPEKVPMCGVPFHAAQRYIAKLVDAGLKVALCDQVEAASGPKLMRREVIRVITPGTVLDDALLEPDESRFLASLCPEGDAIGVALLEASTGEFFAFSCPRFALRTELARFSPKELLLPEGVEVSSLGALSSKPSVGSLPSAAFELSRATALLRNHFGVASLDGFGLTSEPLATRAAGAALRYLLDTQKTQALHVDRIFVHRPEGALLLDETTCGHLELLKTARDGKRKGSLFGVLDRTSTSLGGRRLSRWLTAPLTSLPEIEARLDAVEELSAHAAWRESLVEALRRIADLERLCGRLCLGVGNARDLRALADSLEALPELARILAEAKSRLLTALCGPLAALRDLGELLCRALVDEPPVALKEGGIIREGFDGALDELVRLSRSGKAFLAELEERERAKTGIGSLKVRYNRVFGYALEVTKANLHLVPDTYQRKQTLVGAERFVTPELKEWEEKVLTAEEKRCALEYQLFERLRGEVVERAAPLRAAASAVAVADVLLSFARSAVEHGYVRPTVDDSTVIDIREGRHPVVERMCGADRFVPNDLKLDCDSAQLLVITGPNMAGKSTAMRQVALITLMAQAGAFVPARSARIGLCDRIFTRVGASDDLAAGQSTFMVEMTETAHILHHATAKSLVILDEIGRGTSTFDGLSIAWAVAEHLHDDIGAKTLFATHYHELTELPREKRRARNVSVAVEEVDGKVVFLRRLVPGGADRSYGIEVAKLAGLPKEVIGRAQDILANLEADELDPEGHARLSHRAQPPLPQLSLFAAENFPSLRVPESGRSGPPRLTAAPSASGSGATGAEPPPGPPPSARAVAEAEVLAELADLAVNDTAPLEALNRIARWQRRLSPPDGRG